MEKPKLLKRIGQEKKIESLTTPSEKKDPQTMSRFFVGNKKFSFVSSGASEIVEQGHPKIVLKSWLFIFFLLLTLANYTICKYYIRRLLILIRLYLKVLCAKYVCEDDLDKPSVNFQDDLFDVSNTSMNYSYLEVFWAWKCFIKCYWNYGDLFSSLGKYLMF